MRNNLIKIFYNEKQVLENNSSLNFSKSPLKPKLLIEYLRTNNLLSNFLITKNFNIFGNADFKLAHTDNYISGFFSGGYLSRSNGLEWSPQFANSVRYTNASLYSAIKNSILEPETVSFSPTSGFHHARPTGGSGFCTFSGQVIASVKIWREFNKRGCYLDLDGHFGNSIEDSREFQPELNEAIPENFNFNPTGIDYSYYENLVGFIKNTLEPAILSGKISYVVWCHGADSHCDDDLGHQCSTEYWTKCADFFWAWVKVMDEKLGRPLPVSCALFGGYRSDDYTTVLSLHTYDLVACINRLLGINIEYKLEVTSRKNKNSHVQYSRKRKRRLKFKTVTQV